MRCSEHNCPGCSKQQNEKSIFKPAVAYRHCKEPVHYSRLPEELKLARQIVAIAKQLDIVQACAVLAQLPKTLQANQNYVPIFTLFT
jgi:hypothetical protein